MKRIMTIIALAGISSISFAQIEKPVPAEECPAVELHHIHQAGRELRASATLMGVGGAMGLIGTSFLAMSTSSNFVEQKNAYQAVGYVGLGLGFGLVCTAVIPLNGAGFRLKAVHPKH